MYAILTSGHKTLVYWCIRYNGKIYDNGESIDSDSAKERIRAAYGNIRILDLSAKGAAHG